MLYPWAAIILTAVVSGHYGYQCGLRDGRWHA
jgi:hypothetical protein